VNLTVYIISFLLCAFFIVFLHRRGDYPCALFFVWFSVTFFAAFVDITKFALTDVKPVYNEPQSSLTNIVKHSYYAGPISSTLISSVLSFSVASPAHHLILSALSSSERRCIFIPPLRLIGIGRNTLNFDAIVF
jgi:hypothetical protein